MIIAQDRIETRAADRAWVESRFVEEYAPAAARRGLRLVERAWSPPFDLVDQPVSLYLRWQVADIPSWWAMRSAAGDPSVVAFWKSLDARIVSRERRYLVSDPQLANWPAPIDLSPALVATRGWRETVQVHLSKQTTAEAVEALRAELEAASRALPELEQVYVGTNYVADYGAGHLTWDLRFPDPSAAEKARQSSVWRDRIAKTLSARCEGWTALGLETVGAGRSRAGLAQGVKRTALFRALPGISPERVERWEQDLLEMPAHVTSILNWRLARAIALDWSSLHTPAWTHVWEQEYATLEGLSVDYMVHPHHWAHVDRAFDPESGAQIIDTALCHAYSPLAGMSILEGDAARS